MLLELQDLFCDYGCGIFFNYLVFSQESQSDEQRQNLYSRFYITGRDIAAFFTDCGSDFGSCSLVNPNYDSEIKNSPITEKDENVYSLIDRCGMAVLVNQVCHTHLNYSVVIFWMTC
jgi:vacuolar protein sorting-associated protein 13A/C